MLGPNSPTLGRIAQVKDTGTRGGSLEEVTSVCSSYLTDWLGAAGSNGPFQAKFRDTESDPTDSKVGHGNSVQMEKNP